MARSAVYPDGALPAGMEGKRRFVVIVDQNFTGTVEITFRKGELHKATEKEDIAIPTMKGGELRSSRPTGWSR